MFERVQFTIVFVNTNYSIRFSALSKRYDDDRKEMSRIVVALSAAFEHSVCWLNFEWVFRSILQSVKTTWWRRRRRRVNRIAKIMPATTTTKRRRRKKMWCPKIGKADAFLVHESLTIFCSINFRVSFTRKRKKAKCVSHFGDLGTNSARAIKNSFYDIIFWF